MSTPSSLYRFCRLSLLPLIVLLVASMLGTFPAAGQDVQGLRNQKPISIRGSLSAGLTYYQANGIANRRQPFSWYLSGAPVITIYGVVMPFSLVVSEQERRFSQPFNQYGVSPYYKWVKLHLGYRTIRFSNYTLGGANFLGAGVELNPGKLRLGFVYGQFSRAVAEDEANSDLRYRYVRPTYQRLGYAARLGYGKQTDYVDLLLFKATDRMRSIPTPSRRSQITPMENVAVGLKSNFGLFRHKLLFDIDLGGSVLTRDLLLGIQNDQVPSLRQLGTFMWLNSSSSFFTAGQASARYAFKQGSLQVLYQRVDPDYQSLGSYYFQNDVEQVTVNPTLRLIKGQLTISGSYGLSHDNLNHKRAATTSRTVSGLTINSLLAKGLNLGLTYSNFGVAQTAGVSDLFNDSLAVSVVNTSYGGNLSYARATPTSRHVLSLVASYQNTSDQNQFTRSYTGSTNRLGALSYSLVSLPLKFNATASFTYAAIATAGRRFVTIGPGVNLSREWHKGLFRTTLNHNSQWRTVDGQPDGTVANTGFNVAIRMGMQTLSLGSNLLYNQYAFQADGLTYRNFTEYRGSATYGIRF
ncbi:hypothetical protein [Fibrella forsythiae]|uniref:DUF5723 domain-containing protein n=1 Tax=Fibrella forsythiae TaxID=2817061 RepID=A0ABS3JLG7_9BACT|nr:hypothetical protein [Fibrella forsythiae]MBO0950293.1 hypothetical protein [Fibrella forsythiae]